LEHDREAGAGGEDRDVKMYLPGRNLMLLSKAAIYCALHKIPVIAMVARPHPFPMRRRNSSAPFTRRQPGLEL